MVFYAAALFNCTFILCDEVFHADKRSKQSNIQWNLRVNDPTDFSSVP